MFNWCPNKWFKCAISIKKIIWISGCKSGLGVLLRETRPHLVITHCLAHRLELSFKDGIKSAQPKLYAKWMTLLLGLYYLYRKGPTKKVVLKRCFTSLKQVLPTRVGGTRWLPHTYRAMTYRGLFILLNKNKYLDNYFIIK